MRRVLEILALLAIILILFSVAILPWPANIVIGGMLVAAIIVDSVYAWRARKRQQESGPTDSNQEIPPDSVAKSPYIDFPYS